ncbi:MAG: type IV toxin-antitoxin system AbiEi family antitoxin domain-containing protein, partial [Actinomycetota bacterium]
MRQTSLTPIVLEHLAAHHGIASRAELVQFGLTRRQIEYLLTTERFVRVHDGVYRIASSPATFEASCVAACRASDDLVIAGSSAARLWNFKHSGRDDTVIAIAPHDRTPVGDGVVLRRSNIVPRTDVVERADGIRLTTPPRTWFDRARDMSDPWFEALTEHVIDRHCRVPTLWGTARRLMGRGRPGSARVRRVLSQRAAWQKPADSTLEFDVLRALEHRGVHLVRQHPLRLPNGLVIHLDGADPDLKWGLEVDHVTWYSATRSSMTEARSS